MWLEFLNILDYRYCLEPQKSHQELKVHTFEHRERGELNFIVKSPLDDYTYDANQARNFVLKLENLDLKYGSMQLEYKVVVFRPWW